MKEELEDKWRGDLIRQIGNADVKEWQVCLQNISNNHLQLGTICPAKGGISQFQVVNLLKTISSYYNTHYPYAPVQVYSGLVFNGLNMLPYQKDALDDNIIVGLKSKVASNGAKVNHDCSFQNFSFHIVCI